MILKCEARSWQSLEFEADLFFLCVCSMDELMQEARFYRLNGKLSLPSVLKSFYPDFVRFAQIKME